MRNLKEKLDDTVQNIMLTNVFYLKNINTKAYYNKMYTYKKDNKNNKIACHICCYKT